MANIWLEKSKKKTYKLELLRNAIYRIESLTAKLVSITHRPLATGVMFTMVVDLPDISQEDFTDLAIIEQELHAKRFGHDYYGRLKVIKNDTVDIIDMSELVSLTLFVESFEDGDLVSAKINYF